jgi:hypothetical protein
LIASEITLFFVEQQQQQQQINYLSNLGNKQYALKSSCPCKILRLNALFSIVKEQRVLRIEH